MTSNFVVCAKNCFYLLLVFMFIVNLIYLKNNYFKNAISASPSLSRKLDRSQNIIQDMMSRMNNTQRSTELTTVTQISTTTVQMTIAQPQAKRPAPRIFCFILTQSKNLNTRAKVVYNTWAHKCDNFKFVIKFPANLTQNNEIVNFAAGLNNNTMTEAFELNDLLEPANFHDDKYKDLTNKVYLTLIYLYKKYGYYDWYLKADDDTFVFVDNLRKFLVDKDPDEPVTYGYNFKVIVPRGYHSGGGGYLLSHEALTRIGATLNKNRTSCRSTGTEDVDVARCLRQLDVFPGNSTDELGRERFHPLSIYDRNNGVIYEWLQKYAQNTPKGGLECCSDSTITFHYMDLGTMEKIANLLQEAEKKNETVTFQYIVDKIMPKKN